MPLKAALLEVMDKSGAAYACISCGPLCTGSVADFKKGMEIQARATALKSESDTLAAKAAKGGDPKDYARIARIRIDDKTGDVTIKLTHYENSRLSCCMVDSGGDEEAKKGQKAIILYKDGKNAVSISPLPNLKNRGPVRTGSILDANMIYYAA